MMVELHPASGETATAQPTDMDLEVVGVKRSEDQPDDRPDDRPDDQHSCKRLKMDTTSPTQWREEWEGEQQRSPSEEELRREARVRRTEHLLRHRVRSVLDRGYTNVTSQEMEDMVTVAVMDYFVNYHPSSHVFRRISQLESIVDKCEQKYLHTAKQLSDAKFLLKRLTEMRIERYKSGAEAPYKLIRSVAVQAGARRCRGGDLCASASLLLPTPTQVGEKGLVGGGEAVVRTPTKTTTKPTSPADVSLLPIEEVEGSGGRLPTLAPAVSLQSRPTAPSAFVIDLTDKDEGNPLNKSRGANKAEGRGSGGSGGAQPETRPGEPRSSLPDTRAAAEEAPRKQPVARKATSMRVGRVGALGGGRVSVPVETRRPQELIPLSEIKNPPSNAKMREKVTLPPLPPAPLYPSAVVKPPTPVLKVNKAADNGIMLSWNVKGPAGDESQMDYYQVFACQECAGPSSVREWSNVGDVRALPLPMACTLSQFREGHRYHFVVRAVNKRKIVGDFSHPASIRLLHKLTNGAPSVHDLTAPSPPR